MSASVKLSCGHTHLRRKLASANAEIIKCPFCGEFGEIVQQRDLTQKRPAKDLPEENGQGILDLFPESEKPAPF